MRIKFEIISFRQWLTTFGLCVLAATATILSLNTPIALAVVPSALFVGVVIWAPASAAVLCLVGARTLSDTALLPSTVSTALNVGLSLLVLVVFARTVRWNDRGRPVIVALVTYIAVFTGIGLAIWGIDASIVSDALRAFTIFALASIPLSSGRYDFWIFLRQGAWVGAPSALLVLVGQFTRSPILYSTYTDRAFGTFAHPVAAAGFFSLLFAACAILVIKQPSIGVVALFLLFGGAILSTSSLGGLVTASAGVLLTLIFLRVSMGVRLAVLGLFALGLAFVLVVPGAPLAERVDQLTSTDVVSDSAGSGATNSTSWRLRNWGALLQIWKQRPLFGWGFGSTTVHVQPLGQLPHSGPVRLLVETGLFGFVFCLTVLCVAIAFCAKGMRSSRDVAGSMLTLLLVVVINSLSSNTLSYAPMLFMFAAYWAVGVKYLRSRESDDPTKKSTAPALALRSPVVL